MCRFFLFLSQIRHSGATFSVTKSSRFDKETRSFNKLHENHAINVFLDVKHREYLLWKSFWRTHRVITCLTRSTKRTEAAKIENFISVRQQKVKQINGNASLGDAVAMVRLDECTENVTKRACAVKAKRMTWARKKTSFEMTKRKEKTNREQDRTNSQCSPNRIVNQQMKVETKTSEEK